ncbi:MAG: DUF4244 domain-containing protein [Acidimicrobiales bacterium]|nr:DUF4244 domain-containing protein [Acidimicrobiales bacterium]
MLTILMSAHALLVRATSRTTRRLAADRGQSTAEYALVLLGAAAVALLLVTWATGTDKIGDLMDSILDEVLSKVS